MPTTLKTMIVAGKIGTVFFDDEWDAYGWKTEDFTNGPYDTFEDAEKALREELNA